jgi:ribosome biogenesis GTPase
VHLKLDCIGWKSHFSRQVKHEETVGRVIEEQRGAVLVAMAEGECWASLAGRLRHDALTAGQLPAVGDWVELRMEAGSAAVVRVLDRLSKFSRCAPQTGEEQVVAANVDVALGVAAIGGDFNPRRIERYVTATYESGAQPVAVLTKCDLLDPDAVAERIEEVEAASPGLRAIATSALTGQGIDAVRAAIPPGDTGVLVGSSGTGKSSLINALVGQSVARSVIEINV